MVRYYCLPIVQPSQFFGSDRAALVHSLHIAFVRTGLKFQCSAVQCSLFCSPSFLRCVCEQAEIFDLLQVAIFLGCRLDGTRNTEIGNSISELLITIII